MGKPRQAHIDPSWYLRPRGTPVRRAAGGVVVRRRGRGWQVALAREGGFRDHVLPKGGVDPGESLVAAARREIEEEAGIADLQLLGSLGTLARLNFAKTRWGVTRYFLFVTRSDLGRPTDRRKHPHPAQWHPLSRPPHMFWPEQRRLLITQRRQILALLRAYAQKRSQFS